MAVNPFFNFLTKEVADPTKALLIWDVDLAIQNTMDRHSTPEQRDNMWELFQRTDGGVLFFTGRTHQSVKETFGRDFVGVFEHYSVARFGHGQNPPVFMAPKMEVETVGFMAEQGIKEKGGLIIAESPAEIRAHSGEGKSEKRVYIEKKNTSVALVHTGNGKDSFRDEIRAILEPVANNIVLAMGLGATHWVKSGNDAVEILPKGLDPNNEAHLHLPKEEIDRIVACGLGKDVAVHNFHALFQDRRMMITGDSEPDLKAMLVAKDHYNGMGVFVSNDYKLPQEFKRAVDHTIPHFSMTWGLIGDTVKRLQDAAPIVKIMPPLLQH